jgi:hypothetical protein
MERSKRTWTAPAARPLTDERSRADVADAPVANGVPGPSQLTPN